MLTIVFLFVNMFGLTVLYVSLFFYIRLHAKKFAATTGSTSDHHTTNHELEPWQANLESGAPTVPTTPGQMTTTMTVTVTSEERPTASLPRVPNRARDEGERSRRQMNHVALTLLCYPLSYIICTAPLTITRVTQFAGNQPSLTIFVISGAIYCCSGTCNAALYTATRRGIISWGWLTGKRRKQKVASYDPHFPGRAPVKIAESVVSKTSKSSFRTPHVQEKSRSESDSELNMEFGVADYTDEVKLVEGRRKQGSQCSDNTLQ